MKKLYISLKICIVLLFHLNSFSQDNSKIDSIYQVVKKLYKEQKKDPLQGKKYGIDFNAAYLLASLGDNVLLSGGFSMFNAERKTEIYFPIFYVNSNSNSYNGSSSALLMDAHYRKYLGNTLNGFYIGGLFRVALVNETISTYTPSYNNNYNYYSGSYSYSNRDQTKIGLGFEIGGRVISYSGWYWGWSIAFGKYFGNNNGYGGNYLLGVGDNILIDMDLLKFGYAFK